MSRIPIAVTLFAMLAAALLPFASAQDQTKSWTGWISESQCRVKGMAANHRGCAAMCVKNMAAKWVLVDSGTREVLAIHNQDAVDPVTALGQEIKAIGHVRQDGSIDIDSIKAAHAK